MWGLIYKLSKLLVHIQCNKKCCNYLVLLAYSTSYTTYTVCVRLIPDNAKAINPKLLCAQLNIHRLKNKQTKEQMKTIVRKWLRTSEDSNKAYCSYCPFSEWCPYKMGSAKLKWPCSTCIFWGKYSFHYYLLLPSTSVKEQQ